MILLNKIILNRYVGQTVTVFWSRLLKKNRISNFHIFAPSSRQIQIQGNHMAVEFSSSGTSVVVFGIVEYAALGSRTYSAPI